MRQHGLARSLVASALTLLPTSLLAQDSALLLTGAKVLSPDGSQFLEGQSLLIQGNRITGIGSDLNAPAGARFIELDGKYLIPGLIDLHSHLVLYPYNETNWTDQVMLESTELRTIRGVVAAKQTLDAGFTTIRELGTEGAGWADVALRDAVNMGLIPGPRIYAATLAIVATGCYGPAGFRPRLNIPPGAQEADGPVEVRKAVREQIAAGADWIKVYADYRRKPGDPSTPTFSIEELEAIVDEANSAQVPVAAHASTDEAIRRAVTAGVKTIEHGYEVSSGTLELMRAEGVTLCPTLAAGDAIARYGGWTPEQGDHPRVRSARAMFRRALNAKVNIACGSDVGVFTHGTNAREILLMVEYGMSKEAALRSATSGAAEVLGMGDQLGRLARDYLADVIAVDADPLEDPAALYRVSLVIKDGKVAREAK
ncbi:MAG: metal-dependent hydrolase family protein [Planctomycetota bacterium]|jgi:imidazolonepropionase-like amidohydrolase